MGCLSHPSFSFLVQAVSSTLSIGACLLLPPLRERMELLHSLLPQGPGSWDSLTKGQVSHGKGLQTGDQAGKEEPDILYRLSVAKGGQILCV